MCLKNLHLVTGLPLSLLNYNYTISRNIIVMVYVPWSQVQLTKCIVCYDFLFLVASPPAWLPSLEKELNGLEPHNSFRLWLTTESHPKFPPILLQSSLKITYEAPPGIKRNLQRTYESWSQEYIEQGHSVVRSQALFALAWFHAIVQERRMLIPQGWSKFYEFSLSDLRAGASIIERLCSGPGMGRGE